MRPACPRGCAVRRGEGDSMPSGSSAEGVDDVKLTCPVCGHSGEVRGTGEYFEARGQWPAGHWPVRECRGCGAGTIVKPGLRKARAKLIDGATWAEMQRQFNAAMADLRDAAHS